MDLNKKGIGSRIKLIRLSFGDNMREFGERISEKLGIPKDDSISDSIVSRWEKGVSIPSPDRLKIIARLGNISVEELLYGKKLEIQSFNTGAEFEAERERLLEEYKLNEISNRSNMLENDYVRSLVNIGEVKLQRFIPSKSVEEFEHKVYADIESDTQNKAEIDRLFQMKMDSFYLSIALLDDNSSKLLSNFSIISKDEQELILKLLDSMIKK